MTHRLPDKAGLDYELLLAMSGRHWDDRTADLVGCCTRPRSVLGSRSFVEEGRGSRLAGVVWVAMIVVEELASEVNTADIAGVEAGSIVVVVGVGSKIVVVGVGTDMDMGLLVAREARSIEWTCF